MLRLNCHGLYLLQWHLLLEYAFSFYLADQGQQKKCEHVIVKLISNYLHILIRMNRLLRNCQKRMSGLQMTLNICGNVHQVLFTKIQM